MTNNIKKRHYIPFILILLILLGFFIYAMYEELPTGKPGIDISYVGFITGIIGTVLTLFSLLFIFFENSIVFQNQIY